MNINGGDPEAVYDDTTVNTCGITNTHSFPIIEVIPLYAPNKAYVMHHLYMLRDPRTKESII